MYCETCNADDPPHAPGCRSFASELHRVSQDAKYNGLLMAKVVVMQAGLDANDAELRSFSERICEMLTGAMYGLALEPDPSSPTPTQDNEEKR